MPADDVMSLVIGGLVQTRWETYRIDSDLMVPADEWDVSLSNSLQALPGMVVPGAAVKVMIGEDVILSGTIDDINEPIKHDQLDIMINGRDNAGVLLDCSAPIFTIRDVGIEDVISDVVIPFGIHNVQIQSDQAISIIEKISVEPGESAWDVVQRVAEANGLWPWMDPDGTLVIGGANYSSPVVADLILRVNGIGNNVKSLTRQRSIVGRFSDITVLAQSPSTDYSDGENALSAKAIDPSMTNYRPKIVIDSDSVTLDLAAKRAEKMLSDGRLAGLDLVAEVRGHRITPDGLLWTPGQRIHVVSELHGIDGIYYLMGRTFSRDFHAGKMTSLRLKEDGVWTLAAFPDTRKDDSYEPSLSSDSGND